MSDSLSNLILSLTPDDGSTICNGAMMALRREQVSTLTGDDYAAARDTRSTSEDCRLTVPSSP